MRFGRDLLDEHHASDRYGLDIVLRTGLTIHGTGYHYTDLGIREIQGIPVHVVHVYPDTQQTCHDDYDDGYPDDRAYVQIDHLLLRLMVKEED